MKWLNVSSKFSPPDNYIILVSKIPMGLPPMGALNIAMV